MVYNEDPKDKKKAIEKTYMNLQGLKKEKVSGNAFSIIAIPDDKFQHSVQVRDNYWTTVYRQYIKLVIRYKTIF